jgi:Tfp pilus tip-associated adhesin PilY1
VGKIKKVLWTVILCHFIIIPGFCLGDQTDIFLPVVNPDALIILDISGSMGWTPAGENLYSSTCPNITQCYKNPGIPSYAGPYYSTQQSGTSLCAQSIYNGGKFGDTTACTGPFYVPASCVENENCGNPYSATAPSGHPVNCDRLSIAKRAIFSILDADGNGAINSADYNLLGIRFGYMHYLGCSNEDDGNYSTGCIKLMAGLTTDYSSVWNAVNPETLVHCSATPIAASLVEATSYLTASKTGDTAASCRQKFAIMITDGADTLACNGKGTADSNNYKTRKASVAKAKALADAGYKLFVVGFAGDLDSLAVNTLNWMAYYGGTTNPGATQSGNTSAITPSTNPCNEGSSNDPGNATLSGYAFVASDPADLVAALTQAINTIRQATYSFSVTSVAASRTSSENYLYEASFMPRNDPFWDGYLKKYSLNSDGSTNSVVWEAGQTLKTRNLSSSPRNVFTLRGSFSPPYPDLGFDNPPGQLKVWLGVSTGTLATNIVAYVTGSSTPDNWRLGDIFNSNPIVIGSPSAYYTDALDASSPQAFAGFRSDNQSRQRLLVAGANDGQLHAFQAASTDGTEQWSFIPPNLQQKLQYLYHATDPAPLSQVHTYFADGPITVADVWLGTGDGTSKSKSDWKTLLVFGEGRGVRDQTNNASNTNYLWSNSQYCDSGFNKAYVAGTYKYYCGYHALDVTNTGASRPGYMWQVNADSSPNLTASLPYLGEPWSKMAVGKVKKDGNEKWVGFIGGGYSTGTTSGKGFFVVDLSNGNILWSYTSANNSSMTYIPASPAIVDTDQDGFIDTAYVGDVNGNIWRFKFCTKNDSSSCGTSNWAGGKFFDSSVGTGIVRPIYTATTVAQGSGSLWVLWGTADRENPKSTTGSDHFFAVKDDDRTSTWNINNLQDISASQTNYNGTSKGWYITLSGSGEKIMFDSDVFGGIALFTTYTPPSSSDPCNTQSGTSQLYAIAMTSVTIGGITYDPGAGVLSAPSNSSSKAGGNRSVSLGGGIAKSPVVSQSPLAGNPTNVYLSLSGGGTTSTTITTSAQLGSSPLNTRLTQTAPSSQVLHWRDGRVQ